MQPHLRFKIALVWTATLDNHSRKLSKFFDIWRILNFCFCICSKPNFSFIIDLVLELVWSSGISGQFQEYKGFFPKMNIYESKRKWVKFKDNWFLWWDKICWGHMCCIVKSLPRVFPQNSPDICRCNYNTTPLIWIFSNMHKMNQPAFRGLVHTCFKVLGSRC